MKLYPELLRRIPKLVKDPQVRALFILLREFGYSELWKESLSSNDSADFLRRYFLLNCIYIEEDRSYRRQRDLFDRVGGLLDPQAVQLQRQLEDAESGDVSKIGRERMKAIEKGVPITIPKGDEYLMQAAKNRKDKERIK